jgi:hypothetical protein
MQPLDGTVIDGIAPPAAGSVVVAPLTGSLRYTQFVALCPHTYTFSGDAMPVLFAIDIGNVPVVGAGHARGATPGVGVGVGGPDEGV